MWNLLEGMRKVCEVDVKCADTDGPVVGPSIDRFTLAVGEQPLAGYYEALVQNIAVWAKETRELLRQKLEMGLITGS